MTLRITGKPRLDSKIRLGPPPLKRQAAESRPRGRPTRRRGLRSDRRAVVRPEPKFAQPSSRDTSRTAPLAALVAMAA